MMVLVACEESQRVCQAFRDKGHEAYSCDIIPCSGGHPEWHIQVDVRGILARALTDDIMRGGSTWDLMIAHPPCTYLANSGVCWLYNKDGSVNQDRWGKCVDARNFFYMLRDAPIEKICIENPIPHKYANLPKYTQIIQPWEYGHGETKKTCLWLKNLPKLVPTNIVPGREHRVHRMAPGPTRARDRARTYPGIAEAMADQWGNLR